MKQHPIPQDVTGYKFHLIGNMTLKQFAELIAGAIIAVIIYSTNLIGIVKWPLFIFVILLTVMIAFVPIEERPLDHWIGTFIKNLWKPTKFFWKKSAKAPDFFNYQAGQTAATAPPEVNYSPARQGRIKEYLQSIPNNQDRLDDWDKQRQQQAQQVLTSFDQVKIKVNDISVEKKAAEKPPLKTQVRELRSQKVDNLPVTKTTKNNKETESVEIQTPENLTKEKVRLNTKLSGRVLDSQGQAVARALVEFIQQDSGQTVRLVKTDAAGQFSLGNPLPSGDYQINTEATNLQFPQVQFNSMQLSNQPIIIQAKQ